MLSRVSLLVPQGARSFSRSTSVVSSERNKVLASLPSGSITGRNSYSGLNVCVLGATGFVARYLVNDIGRAGHVICAAHRDDDMAWRHLKVLTDLGKLFPFYMDPNDLSSIEEAITDADVVVNLIGKHYETKHLMPWVYNWKFDQIADLHGEIARIARQKDVKHFIQLSSTAVTHPGTQSAWTVSKKRAEDLVKKEFPGAVVLRSNIIYGEEDRFLNTFGKFLIRSPVFPLVAGGEGKIQPVYVGDVAKAIKVCIENFETAGNTYALHGDYDYTCKEVAEYIGEKIRCVPRFLDLDALTIPGVKRLDGKAAELVGKVFNIAPNPILTHHFFDTQREDQLESNDEQGVLKLEDLGLKPSNFESKALTFVAKYRMGGQYTNPKSEEVTHS